MRIVEEQLADYNKCDMARMRRYGRLGKRGCVEGATLEEALRVIKTSRPVLEQYGIT